MCALCNKISINTTVSITEDEGYLHACHKQMAYMHRNMLKSKVYE